MYLNQIKILLLLAIALLFLSTGCDDRTKKRNEIPPGPGPDISKCSLTNVTGNCENSDEVCINGVCIVPLDPNPDPVPDPDPDPNGDDDGDDNVNDDNKTIPQVDPGIIKLPDNPYIINHANEILFTLKGIAQQIKEQEDVYIGPDDIINENDVDESEFECDFSLFDNNGPHDQCMNEPDVELDFGFNYTDSADNSNYGTCQLFIGDNHISEIQYIYDANNKVLGSHDILYECLLMMTCLEGIYGTVDNSILANQLENGEIDTSDVEVHIKAYENGNLTGEMDDVNIETSFLIISNLKMPIDQATASHTLEFIDSYMDYIKTECMDN